MHYLLKSCYQHAYHNGVVPLTHVNNTTIIMR